MHPIDGVVALALFGLTNELTAQPSACRLRRQIDRAVDVFVAADALDEPALLHLVEQTAPPVDVVILQIHQRDLRMREADALTLAIALEQVVFDDPVALAIE